MSKKLKRNHKKIIASITFPNAKSTYNSKDYMNYGSFIKDGRHLGKHFGLYEIKYVEDKGDKK